MKLLKSIFLLASLTLFTSVSQAADPIGSFDEINCNTISGWAVDFDAGQGSIGVYTYDNFFPQAVYGGTANLPRPDVDAFFGWGGVYGVNHGFRFPTPAAFKDGREHTVYIHAINVGPGVTREISFSPKTINCPAIPVITSASQATATRNISFAYQTTATNGPILSYAATGLPSGLTMSQAGWISGIPTTAGTFTVEMTATSANGTSGIFRLTLTVLPGPPPVINSPSSANAMVSVPFSYQVTATGNPTQFTAIGLPIGLSLHPTTGLISGIPTGAVVPPPATHFVTIRAGNSLGISEPFTLRIPLAPFALPVITSTFTVTGLINQPFSFQIVATNNPTSYSALGLPSGLTLNTATGLISGTPTVLGQRFVTITVTNAAGTTEGRNLTLTIFGPPTITSPATTTAVAQDPFSFQIRVAANPSPPTSYSATGLPAGLSLNTTTGLISGIATTQGTYDATLVASNAYGSSPARNLRITVLPPRPVVTSPATATGVVGLPFNYQITGTNNPTGFNAPGLPLGLTVSTTTGRISGTPTTLGTRSLTIYAFNAGGTGLQTLTITITPPVLPIGVLDSADCNQITGWTCDPDNFATSLTIHLYADGAYVTQFAANGSRPDIAAQCGGTTAHGFSIPTPASLKTGTPRLLYPYAINIGTGTGNPLLTSAPRTITCAPVVNNAAFVSQVVPSTMTAGQTYPVQVTMRNTGTTTWNSNTPNPYRLGSQNPQDNRTWGFHRVQLTAGETVAPGATKTFTFNVVAPSTAGAYNFQWKMVYELIEWFGASSPNVTVNVSNPLPAPTGLTAVCSAGATQMTLRWNPVAAAQSYYVRVNNIPNDTPSCSDGWYCSDPPDKYLDAYSTTTLTMAVTPGHNYRAWVHSYSSSRGVGPATQVNFLCTAPSSPACDVNRDGIVSLIDVQSSLNQTLGLASCSADINQNGYCNVIDTQRIINASLSGSCVTSALANVPSTGTLRVGTDAALPGNSVSLPIDLTGTANISSLQFVLTLPSNVSTISISPGTALTNAGKSISAVKVGSQWRFAITGSNQTSISGGNLMSLRIGINPGTSAGTLSVPISGIVLVNGASQLITGVTSSNGSITVQPPASPAPVITNAATELSAVRVYPSPWRSNIHTGHPVTFSGLTADATVKIFTVSGRWVKSVSSTGSQATWDLKNDSGDTVASGLYIYLVTDSQGNKARGKFSVIR
jgi:hypothetical protein